MSGYYPDGVTGNEFAIAGADREWTDEREDYCTNEDCELFEETRSVEVELQSYRSTEWGTWKCESCGQFHDYEGEVDDSPDYDYEPEDYIFD